MRKTSKELEQKIVDEYYTATAKELSIKYDINANTIKSIWNRNNCKNKNLFSPNEQEFIKYYLSHEIKETASYFSRDRHTIVKYAKTIGIYQKKKPVLTQEQEDEIKQSYYTSTSSELSEKYNVSTSKIAQVWTKAGLKGKDPRVYHLDETFFDKIDTDEKAYWTGFIAADGCIHQYQDTRQDTISFSLKATDANHLKKFAEALKTNKPLSYGENSSSPGHYYASLQISSDRISNSLQAIGITPNKTYTLTMPDIPEEFIPAYLRGYFDGDGSISSKIELNKLHSVNVNIVGWTNNLESMQKILFKYNIPSSIILDKRKNHYTKKGFASLALPNKQAKNDFLHLIYDNASVYLDRKYQLAQRFIELFNKNPRTWTTKNNADTLINRAKSGKAKS